MVAAAIRLVAELELDIVNDGIELQVGAVLSGSEGWMMVDASGQSPGAFASPGKKPG